MIASGMIYMYTAKKNDRNSFQIYSHAININAYSRLKKDNDLRNAFSRDEFLVYYHPIEDLGTKVIKKS